MLCCIALCCAEVNEAYHQELVIELRELREQNYTLTAQKNALEKMCSEMNQQIQQLHQQRLHSPQERRHSKGGHYIDPRTNSWSCS